MGSGLNGSYKEDFVMLSKEIKEDTNEIRVSLIGMQASFENLSQSIQNLERAVLHLSSTMQFLRKSVPIDVVAWIFAIVFLSVAGIGVLKEFLPTIAKAAGWP